MPVIILVFLCVAFFVYEVEFFIAMKSNDLKKAETCLILKNSAGIGIIILSLIITFA